jgi:glycosyltransferase involved in cell wall biosynthesis
MPKVSVVIPCYNSAQYLPATIDSVLGQALRDFEVIFVDSASQDASVDIIQSYNDDRIKLLTFPRNALGILERNLGIMEAQGTYVAIMDADDLMHPQRLEKQVNYLEGNPDVDILGTNFSHFDGTKYSKRIQQLTDGKIKAKLLFVNGNALHNPTVMIRKRFLDQNNLFYPPLIIDSDHSLWVSCMKEGARFANLEDDLLTYRRHATNLTAQKAAQLEAWKTPIRREILGAFFPDFTFHECEAIAKVMEKKRKLNMAEAFAGIAAMDKVMRMGHCELGADIGEVKNILGLYQKQILYAVRRSQKGQ